MSDNPTLAWSQLIIQASGLGRRMKILSEALKADHALEEEYDDLAGEYEEDPAELYENMRGIVTVLKIIGETPNANINAEGMAAIRCEVEGTALIERATKPLLDKVDPTIW